MVHLAIFVLASCYIHVAIGASSQSAGTAFTNLESDNAQYQLLIGSNGKLELSSSQDGSVKWSSANNDPAASAILSDTGDFKLLATDGSMVLLIAENTATNCVASTVEVSDVGTLNLICPNGAIAWSVGGETTTTDEITTTTSNPCTLEMVASPECFFMSDVADKYKLLKRCQAVKSARTFVLDRRRVMVDGRRCGVTNSSDIEGAETCYSNMTTDDTAEFVIKQTVRFIKEAFLQEYSTTSRLTTAFFTKKLDLEIKMGKSMLSSDQMVNAGFESVVITNMKSWTNSDKELKIEAVLYAQFSAFITNETYAELWDELVLTDKYLKENIVPESIATLPLQCPDLKEMKDEMPPEIWTASNYNEEDKLRVGELVNFRCPVGWKLSFDNDTFNGWDDQYTVTCLPIASSSPLYTAPKYWPSCRKDCKKCLPDPPEYTGLMATKSPNSIPIGQFGVYQCIDSSLGVDSGPSEFFNVLCEYEDYFRIPEEYFWPICLTKTTTIRPIVFNGFNQTLHRRVEELSLRHSKNEFIDLSVPLSEPEPYFLITTLPSVAVMAILIWIMMYLTSINSFLCKICSEKANDVEKVIIPMEDEEDEESSSDEQEDRKKD